MLGIIPAAGKGTRIGEFCEHYPKVLFPYKDEPILFHNINWLIASGCDKIVVVVNYKKEFIKEALTRYALRYTSNYWSTSFCIITQEELNGTAYSVALALRDLTAITEVLMVFGDLIPTRLLTWGELQYNFVSIEEVKDYKRWVMIDIDEEDAKQRFVKKFITKPQERPYTRWSWSGIFYVTRSDYLVSAIQRARFEQEDPKKELCISKALAFMPFSVRETPIINFGTHEDCLESVGQEGIDKAQKTIYNLLKRRQLND